MADVLPDPLRGSFNKWQMYTLLSARDIGPCRLPATFLWDPAALPHHLRRFQSLYVKPLDAWGGHGVSLVEAVRVLPGTLCWTRDGGTRAFTSLPELTAALVSVYPPRAAIVQQAAPLCRYDGRVFDVRVLMQRTPADRWTTGGMLARVGGEGSVVSNVEASHGTVRTLADALSRALPRPQGRQGRIRQIEANLAAASHKVCHAINSYRHFIEVGLDFGVDPASGLWLIEVNTDDALGGPSHELFAHLPDRRVYERIEARRRAYDRATLRMVRKAMSGGGTP